MFQRLRDLIFGPASVPEPPPPPPPFARKDEIATCENGHPIASLKKDLRDSDYVLAEFFCAIPPFKQPKNGDLITDCPICGAPWFRRHVTWSGTTGVSQLHFVDGWRP